LLDNSNQNLAIAPMTAHVPPVTRADLFTFLEGLAIATRTVEHPAVFTVEESEKLDREMPGGHTKNLFLKDAKGRLFLVVAEARASIDMKSLHKALDCARLSFGKPELLLEVLGITPGSVTAFAVLNDSKHRVSVIIDETLMGFETVNCHPLVNTATTNIGRDDLMKFMRATGHEPRIVRLPTAAP
jgi:Ala-tRNA(Pro) deacylase